MEIDRVSGGGYSNYQQPARQVENISTDNDTQKEMPAEEDMIMSAAEMLLNQNEEPEKEVDEENIGQNLNDIKKKMGNTECKFGIDEETNRITIKIIDKQTKKVIKEVPPEKTLKMIAKVWEMAGILVDKKL